jgi:cytochrome c oxidase assembly factor CtaG
MSEYYVSWSTTTRVTVTVVVWIGTTMGTVIVMVVTFFLIEPWQRMDVDVETALCVYVS